MSALLKAIQHGYLKGCPNLTAHGVTKSLNPSPATAKGHMKQPRRGIRSTRTPSNVRANASPPIVTIEPMPQIPFDLIPHVIEDEAMANMLMNANIYCFAAFADKHTGTIYNDLTGTFPFVSLKGNICFLVVYHYESNAILALPIFGFSDEAILRAYKEIYE